MNARVAAAMLTVLSALFVARVVGQALVAFVGVGWLPPMTQWYSGLLPYPVLLPLQVVIVAVQVAIVRQAWRGSGVFGVPRPRAARALRWVSYVYAGGMAVRYVVTGSHAIPVAFHLVLAAWLFTAAARLEPCIPHRATSNCCARDVSGPNRRR